MTKRNKLKQHKILEEQFGIKREDLLENTNISHNKKSHKIDEENGFVTGETWCLDVAFVYWLAERVYRYKEVASKVIDLEWQDRFEYEGKKCTQLELIDLLLDNCKKFISLDNSWDPEYDVLWKKIVNIWSVIGLAMWW